MARWCALGKMFGLDQAPKTALCLLPHTTNLVYSGVPNLEILMSHTSPLSDTKSAAALGRALDQNSTVKDTVEQSAAELALINTVLKVELPGHVQKGEVAQALRKTDDLEMKIQDTAQDLAEVNKVLAQEIDARVDLESKLAAAKAALAHEKASS